MRDSLICCTLLDWCLRKGIESFWTAVRLCGSIILPRRKTHPLANRQHMKLHWGKWLDAGELFSASSIPAINMLVLPNIMDSYAFVLDSFSPLTPFLVQICRADPSHFCGAAASRHRRTGVPNLRRSPWVLWTMWSSKSPTPAPFALKPSRSGACAWTISTAKSLGSWCPRTNLSWLLYLIGVCGRYPLLTGSVKQLNYIYGRHIVRIFLPIEA